MSTIDNAKHHTVEDASHELFSVVTEVNVVHLVFTLLAAFILVFGMISALIKEKLYAGEAIVATAFGVIFGPHCAKLINPRAWGNPSFDDITLEFTRIVLALSVFAVGVELPRAYVKRHWRSLIMVLGPLMISGWLITGGLIYALVPGLNFLGALVVAACATPTDPILAASVVGKGKFAQKHVPSHIRHLLQCESGCNDGAAFPFLYLAMFLIFREDRSAGHAIGMWIVLVILYQILLGIVIGAATGIIARKLLKFAKRRDFIDRESMVAMYVSLAIFTTAVTTLAGSDDLLAAFACGAAFAWDDWFSESIEDSNFSNILDLLINCATFIYIGATMPFSDFNNTMLTLEAWRLAVLGICVLLIRRLPVMLALYKFIPDIKTFREAIFAGFFGPMGVGAIFIATLALTKLPTPNIPPETPEDVLALTIQPITYFLVLCSIIVHGSSVPFFNLGKRVHTVTRTWTNRSEANEPSWLSRVKRAGDANDNNDREHNEKDEKMAERKRLDNGDVDIEAGDQAIDDPALDTGDFSSRDYATGYNVGSSTTRHSSGTSGNKVSPTASSEGTVAGDRQSPKEGEDENAEEASDKRTDKRPERHDSGGSDSDEDWDEGSDIVHERHHGEDVTVEHKDKSKDQLEHHESDAGPGFPGHRFQEIEKMLGGGGGTDDVESGDDEDDAEDRRSREGEEDDEEERDTVGDTLALSQSAPTHTPSSYQGKASGDNLREASKRVAAKQIAEEHAQPSADLEGHKAPSSSLPEKAQRPDISKAAGGAKSRLSAVRLASMTGLARPQPNRKPTLTAEEKKARDAWCRKERKDVDDDQVKTWISGKHLVLERNNGEDVEIVDANPSRVAREKAKKFSNMNVRELPIKEVKEAQADIDREQSQPQASSSHPKRFDLKALAGKQSFRKLFGGDESSHSPERQSGPSSTRDVPTITEDAPEEEAVEAQALPEAASSSRTRHQSDNTDGENNGNIRFAEMPAAVRQRSNAVPPQEETNTTGDVPNYLSTRKTGISMDRTDTTDSQVRFAKLPIPSRK